MSEAMKVDTLNEEYSSVVQELKVADAEYDRLFEKCVKLESENQSLKSFLEKMTTLLELVAGNVRN